MIVNFQAKLEEIDQNIKRIQNEIDILNDVIKASYSLQNDPSEEEDSDADAHCLKVVSFPLFLLIFY